jgi:hypothetical protein
MVMSWAKIVVVRTRREGAQWCRDNLNHNDWVAYEDDGVLMFGFKDEAVAIEFALRFS